MTECIKTDLTAFLAGAFFFNGNTQRKFNRAIQELFTKGCSRYKNEEKILGGVNVVCLEICKEFVKNQ